MKKFNFIFGIFITILISTQVHYSADYEVWKCSWKELKFDDKKYFDLESTIEKSKNEMIFFGRQTKYDNYILSYTSDLGTTWERDSFLYTGNYTLNSKNQLFVYDRPSSRLNIINAWTMYKRGKIINIPIFIRDAFFELNDSILIAMPRYDANNQTTFSYLINLNDSTSRPMGPIDSTGEIIEEFRRIRYVYKSNIPNRICFVNDKGEFYYSDNFGDSATLFYQDPQALIRNFETKNGRFYYCKPGPTFTKTLIISGMPVKIECIVVYIVRLNDESGTIDTVFQTYTQEDNIISNQTAKLKNAGKYIAIISNNDSLFYSDDYGDNFYYIPFPEKFKESNSNKVEVGISNKGEVILKWYDTTAGGRYMGAIGKPYPNPYSVSVDMHSDYKIYTQDNQPIIEFGVNDFLSTVQNIELYDIYGKKIENIDYEIFDNKIKIKTSQITSGVYLLILENKSRRTAWKLLISN